MAVGRAKKKIVEMPLKELRNNLNFKGRFHTAKQNYILLKSQQSYQVSYTGLKKKVYLTILSIFVKQFNLQGEKTQTNLTYFLVRLVLHNSVSISLSYGLS